jgi:hypothetical protein
MTWPVRVWAVGEILTAANMIAFLSDPLQNIDDLLDLAGPTTFVDGAFLFGAGATTTFKQSAVLANGEILVGDGVTTPVALAAFASSTGLLKTEQGGLEADVTGVATGGLPKGTGAGSFGILARGAALDFLRVNSGGTDIEWTTGGADVTLSAVSFARIRLFGH